MDSLGRLPGSVDSCFRQGDRLHPEMTLKQCEAMLFSRFASHPLPPNAMALDHMQRTMRQEQHLLEDMRGASHWDPREQLGPRMVPAGQQVFTPTPGGSTELQWHDGGMQGTRMQASSRPPLCGLHTAFGQGELLLSEMEDAWGRDESWMAVPILGDEPQTPLRQYDEQEFEQGVVQAAAGAFEGGGKGNDFEEASAARDECHTGWDAAGDVGSRWSDDVVPAGKAPPPDECSGLAGGAPDERELECNEFDTFSRPHVAHVDTLDLGASRVEEMAKELLLKHLRMQQRLLEKERGQEILNRTRSLLEGSRVAADMTAKGGVPGGGALENTNVGRNHMGNEKALSDGSLREKRRDGAVKELELVGDGLFFEGQTQQQRELTSKERSPAKKARRLSPSTCAVAQAHKAPCEFTARLGAQLLKGLTPQLPTAVSGTNKTHLDRMVDKFRAQDMPVGMQFLPIPRVFRALDG